MTHTIEIIDRDEEVEAEDGQDVINALLEGGVEWMDAGGG